jgi:hypothetical protein
MDRFGAAADLANWLVSVARQQSQKAHLSMIAN